MKEQEIKDENPEIKEENEKLKFGCIQIITGRVCKAPEVRYTPTGKKYTSFSLTHGGFYDKEKGVRVKESIWQDCQAWGELGQSIALDVKKGDVVRVTGKRRQSVYQGRKYEHTSVDQLETEAGNIYFADVRGEET